jgi:6-pyruvoyltetrahydropterin/6-carboxytetrahydropterin synthase
VIARDDPQLATFEALARDDLIDLRVMPAVGCEATARFVFDYVDKYIDEETNGRVWIESVEVKEHGGNSAIFERPSA